MCISNPTQIWNAQATYKRAHIYSLLWAWESKDNLWFSSKTHAVLFTLQLQVVHIQSGGGGDPIVHMCSKQAMGTQAANRCRSSNASPANWIPPIYPLADAKPVVYELPLLSCRPQSALAGVEFDPGWSWCSLLHRKWGFCQVSYPLLVGQLRVCDPPAPAVSVQTLQ